MVQYPCFIDFEASSLRVESYPIAVAWNRVNGEIRRFLISPQGMADWSDWDPDSEAIHGIDRQRLLANGWPADYVIEELERDLSEQTVWADAPNYDNHWLSRLYEPFDREPPLTLSHIENLLIPLLKRPGELDWQAAARMGRLIQDLSAFRHDQHDPGADVGWLMRLWEGAQGMPLRANHRNGPLPADEDSNHNA